MNLSFRRVVLFLVLLSGIACFSSEKLSPEDVVKLQRAAMEFSDAGEYKEAGKLYKYLLKHTEDVEQKAFYTLHLAESYLYAEKLQDARENFELLLKKYPYYLPYDRVLARLRQLAALYEEGKGTFLGFKDADAALKIYRMILAEHASLQSSLPDRMKYAELLLETGAKEEAAAVYFEILRELPGLDKVRYLYIKLLADLSRYGDGDGGKLRAVRREIRMFLKQVGQQDPRHAEIAALSRSCDEIAAGRVLTQAEFYLLKHYRRPEIARRYLHDVIREFPDTAVAAKAKEILQREFPSGNLETGGDQQ